MNGQHGQAINVLGPELRERAHSTRRLPTSGTRHMCSTCPARPSPPGPGYPPCMPESAATTPLLTGRFQRAFTLASELHGDQVRKGTTVPYLAHLMSVAALVLEHGGAEDAAIGGLLHDSIEDSADGAQTEARIRREFGGRIAEIVAGCSDAVAVPGQDKPPWRERKEAYIARLA